MSHVEWMPKAYKQMRRFPLSEQARIIQAVDGLADWPDCRNVARLTDRPGQYRLRVGSYRVIFRAIPDGRMVLLRIEEVKKRDEHTY